MKGKNLLVFMLFLPFVISAEPANQFLRQGQQALSDHQPEQAVEAFRQALDLAESTEALDESVARLALGTAHARNGNWDRGVYELTESLKTDNLDVQQKAHFNLGRAYFDQAEPAAQQNQLPQAQSGLENSVRHFRDALQLTPSDRDAKVSYEIAHRRLEAVKEQMQQQQQQQDQQQDDNQDSSEEDSSSDSPQNQQNESSDSKPSQNSEQNQTSPQDQNPSQDDATQQNGENQPKPEDPETPSPSAGESGEQDPSSPTNNAPRASRALPEQMTPEEAERLLEAIRAEEEQQRGEYRIRLGRPVPVDKNW